MRLPPPPLSSSWWSGSNQDPRDVFDPVTNDSTNRTGNDNGNFSEQYNITNLEFEFDFDFDNDEVLHREKKEVVGGGEGQQEVNYEDDLLDPIPDCPRDNDKNDDMNSNGNRNINSNGYQYGKYLNSNKMSSMIANKRNNKMISSASSTSASTLVSTLVSIDTSRRRRGGERGRGEKATEDGDGGGIRSDDVEEITSMMSDMWERTEYKNTLPPIETSHQTLETMSKVDKILAKELYEMDHPDREAIADEIHGIKSRSIVETPQLIQESLLEMERVLQQHKQLYQQQDHNSDKEENGNNDYDRNTNDTTAAAAAAHTAAIDGKEITKELMTGYIRAITILNSTYVTSREIRLKFLRCELFDLEKAVVRYLNNLNYIHELFGDRALLRPIYLTDLTKNEVKHLKGKYRNTIHVTKLACTRKIL